MRSASRTSLTHKAFTLIELPAVRKSKRRAFTLIELLVVISVISILAAITLPMLSRARAAGRNTQCISNLSQIGKAIDLYVDDHDQWYPCASTLPSTEPSPGLPRIRDLLEPYGSAEIFRCPDDRRIDPEYPHPTYFEGEGSSYDWAEIVNHLKKGMPIRFAPFKLKDIPIVRDYECFHRRGSGRGSFNGLFHDGHVESF